MNSRCAPASRLRFGGFIAADPDFFLQIFHNREINRKPCSSARSRRDGRMLANWFQQNSITIVMILIMGTVFVPIAVIHLMAAYVLR